MFPITANCTRLSGSESTLAPTSSSSDGVGRIVGRIVASAGRSTPASIPSTILAVAMAAPVLPAVKNPAARPSRTILRPTRMVESRLVLTACAALSSMLIHSLAGATKMGRCCPPSAFRSDGRMISSGPTRCTRTSSWRHASMAPRTSGSGALSEPIASTTMSIGISLRALWDQYFVVRLACFFDRKNVAALVGATLAAGAVRKLGFGAVWALGEAGRCQKIVAAALGSPLLGVAPFWIRHCCIPLNLPRQSRKKHAVDEAKLISASTRACPPDPQAHSNADQPEPHRRNISLDSDSDHSAGKALCSPPYRGCDSAGTTTPA